MIYSYRHPSTGEVKDVAQGVSEEHRYVDEDGLQWERVFSTLTPIIAANPNSLKDFVEKTNKKSTVGEVWDRAQDLSNRRAQQNGGIDPVKAKYYKDYAAKRGGKRHINDKP